MSHERPRRYDMKGSAIPAVFTLKSDQGALPKVCGANGMEYCSTMSWEAVGNSSQASCLSRNSAMDDSIGDS